MLATDSLLRQENPKQLLLYKIKSASFLQLNYQRLKTEKTRFYGES